MPGGRQHHAYKSPRGSVLRTHQKASFRLRALASVTYTVNLHAKFGTNILYKSPRGSVLRTPATLTGIRTFRPLRGPVLIPVVLRNGYRPAESKLSPDGNHSSGTYKAS